MSAVSPIVKQVHFKEEVMVHIIDELCYELKPSSSVNVQIEVFEKAANNDRETVAFLQMSCMKDRSGTLLLNFLSYIDNLKTVPALIYDEFFQGLDTRLIQHIFKLALQQEPKIASKLIGIFECYIDVTECL